MVQLRHIAVASDSGSQDLFLAADYLHFLIGKPGIRARPRAACAIGAGNSAEPLLRGLKAGGNPVERHEFQIILVSPNPQMGHPPQGLRHFHVIRYEHRGTLLGEFHVMIYGESCRIGADGEAGG